MLISTWVEIAAIGNIDNRLCVSGRNKIDG